MLDTETAIRQESVVRLQIHVCGIVQGVGFRPFVYKLAHTLRFVLLSATESEDKQLKYPTIFNSSDVAIITKMNMLETFENQTIEKSCLSTKWRSSASESRGRNETLRQTLRTGNGESRTTA
jgi:Ni2+-binding GTPase involved in maturation of urease and hydrogenase